MAAPAPLLAAAAAVVALLAAAPLGAMCPPQCRCRDDAAPAAASASCAGARLAVFPIQLNPDVTSIDLSDNRIPSIDYTLTFYINLVRLDLAHNRILSLGSHNFERQENLTFLNVSFNQISRLGKGTFKGLKLLKLLDLSNNTIESVESTAFKDTVELEVLDLTNNRITSFEDPLVFKHLEKLKRLFLDGNQLLDVPSGLLQHLPSASIEVLSLSNNYIDALDDTSFPSPALGSLKRLSLASNAVSSVSRSSFNSLRSLSVLDLSDNNLTVVPTEQLSKLSQLADLDLGETMFAELPSVAFQSLFHLKVLRLSRMPRLRRIDSRAFVDNIHLESVIMDDNREVTSLPARLFLGNLHLRHVSFRRNSLRTMDASHFPVDSLLSLDVSGNPLECNCSLLWLWTLAAQEKVTQRVRTASTSGNDSQPEAEFLRLSTGQLRCAGPPELHGLLLTEVPHSAVRCDASWLTVAVVSAVVLALFGATCLVLLLIGDDRPFSLSLCSLCRARAKEPLDPPPPRHPHLAPAPHPGAVLMLMPDKEHYLHSPNGKIPEMDWQPCRSPRDLRYMEPWVRPARNEYTLDSPRKPAHVVYV